ncbi:MAG TPA: TetR/AcrR family transcriptional regulator [Terriglobales bacterium]|nr:TetR/AcrR family transcriptional regulator [Terriglobales bacterium]
MKSGKSVRPTGRPRAFDIDRALDRALKVFWSKGYEGASLSDLTKAMGINRPSLYAAFGDKEGLFRKALDRYSDRSAAYFWEALKQPAARAVVEKLLQGTADSVTDPRNPRGCLYVQGALACGKEADCIRRELISRRAAGEVEIYKRLKRAKADGDLPPDSNPADLARFIATMSQGIAVQAAGGATRAELERVVQTALRAWPK